MANDLVSYNYGLVPYRRNNPFLEEAIPPMVVPTQPESPETAMARRDPSGTARLLRQMSRDRVTMSALETASVITHDYLRCMPQERLAQSSGIKVSFGRKHRFPFGEENGFTLDIDLKR